MTTIDAHTELKRNAVIHQLRGFNYHDIDDKTYRELVYKLASFRATEINIASDSNRWF